MATVAALLGIEESRALWAVWDTTQLHIGGYRSVRSGEWLVTFRSSSSDNPWTSLLNHPFLCLIAPISQHIMLPQSTVATAIIFNWENTCSTVIFYEINIAHNLKELLINNTTHYFRCFQSIKLLVIEIQRVFNIIFYR